MGVKGNKFAKKYEFTEDMKKQIIDMYNNGVSTRKLAAHFNMSRAPIYKILSEAKQEGKIVDKLKSYRYKYKKLEEVDTGMVFAVRKAGWSVEEIAKDQDTTVDIIKEILGMEE